jgi:hypothetical protein
MREMYLLEEVERVELTDAQAGIIDGENQTVVKREIDEHL